MPNPIFICIRKKKRWEILVRPNFCFQVFEIFRLNFFFFSFENQKIKMWNTNIFFDKFNNVAQWILMRRRKSWRNSKIKVNRLLFFQPLSYHKATMKDLQFLHPHTNRNPFWKIKNFFNFFFNLWNRAKNFKPTWHPDFLDKLFLICRKWKRQQSCY